MLFDEPSQGLAPKVVQDVMKTITAAARTKASRCWSSSRTSQSALAVADRAYVLDRGRVVHAGPAAALRDDARAARAELLGV